MKAYRYDERPYEIGDELPHSRVWDDGDLTDETLPGTSCLATEFDARHGKAYSAVYEYKYLVEGDVVAYGEDPGEVILAHCIIVARV